MGRQYNREQLPKFLIAHFVQVLFFMMFVFDRLLRFVRIQAKRMAGGVDQCAGSFEILLTGKACSQAEGVADGFFEVVHIEIEV